MTEVKKKRSEDRFEREAKALQKNLEKRKAQHKALDDLKKKKKKEQEYGQTKD